MSTSGSRAGLSLAMPLPLLSCGGPRVLPPEPKVNPSPTERYEITLIVQDPPAAYRIGHVRTNVCHTIPLVILILLIVACGKTGILTDAQCLETVNREIDFMRPYLKANTSPIWISDEDELREDRMNKCKRADTWYDQQYRACILSLPPPGYKATECTVEALKRRRAKP